MTSLITIADFAGIVPFSVNIGAHLVDPHVADAQLLDFLPRLPEALRTDLAAPRPWGAGLEALWADHLRRVLVLESARRLLLWHGLHITPDGAENTARLPITDQQRAQLRADLQTKAAHFWPTALAAAGVLYPPTPSTTCGAPRRRPGNGGLRTAAL
jgi:hypothetical protein